MAHGANYRIEVSYLEIYNEKVKDLLRKDSGHNLKIRQHPTKGPCVMDLSRHLVSEYAHIRVNKIMLYILILLINFLCKF